MCGIQILGDNDLKYFFFSILLAFVAQFDARPTGDEEVVGCGSATFFSGGGS